MNELSRFGDQLPRARQRLSGGTASVLIAPSARREPTHTALARAAERELYAEDERSQRALVSIHVEVSHPQLQPDALEAQVVEAQAESVEQDREPLRALPADAPRFMAAASEDAAQLSSDAFEAYAAGRGFGAYAAQRAFTRPSSGTRLLDVRA